MYKSRKIVAIVVAAGAGTRLGGPLPKQFLKVGSRTILEMSVAAFEQNECVDEIVIAANPEYMELTEKTCASFCKVTNIVPGGAERQDSVRAALSCVLGASDAKFCGGEPKNFAWSEPVAAASEPLVLVHDAARPFVTQEVIANVVKATCETGAAVPVVPVKDTVRQILGPGAEGTGAGSSGHGAEARLAASVASRTLDRSTLVSVQTPQGFFAQTLKAALENAKNTGFIGTDDASLVENMGINISICQGDYANRKITTKEDLPDLETGLRIGHGYDVHRLVEGRKLILCGEEIPHELGLLGHSDADVALHALMDAMLGAAALGDIGKHFPDTDEKYRGISSMKLLQHVVELLRAEGFFLVNADITIIAQRPKIAGYIPKMRENIASVIGCDVSQINIKGTTTERLGFAGREEGIASEAVCILNKK